MHKRIKNIIAVSLIIAAISGIVPVSGLGLGSIKAYAATHHYSDDDLREEAYLEGIYLSNGDIEFDKMTTDYDVSVGDDIDKITVRAKASDEEDIVQINGDSVENQNYEKTVNLEKGKNVIKIFVETNDDNNTYVLNVYRGGKDITKEKSNNISTSTSVVSNTSSNTVNGVQNFAVTDQVIKNNSWNRSNGKWQYMDGTGQALKEQWFSDSNTGINYYLDKDGYRAVGWLYNNNNWYHFNNNGEMETGWICLNKNWYYLNESGAMKMGWLEDSSGNWYYLDNDGEMKTGWIENSDGKWYYLDSTGKMIKDTAVNGYTSTSNGTSANIN